jgi:hypothetical protein
MNNFKIGDKVWYNNVKAGFLKGRIISIEKYGHEVLNIQIKITSRKNKYLFPGCILHVSKHEIGIR